MRLVVFRGALLACVVAACGDPAARVTLVPVDHACGRPAGATAIRVIAYTGAGETTRAVGLDEQVDIADFPGDTEQLGVEVAVGGGEIGAIGKTAPLAFADLADGTQIPVLMAPPNGFCPTVTPMTEAREAPLVARVGDRVLVVGGHDGAGRWLPTAELYDPATGTFTPVEVPDVLGENGFAGTTAATLPDGVLALSGGPQPVITLFGQGGDRFGESVLIEARAFHASIAIDDERVLVAGGCSDVAAGACAGVARKSTRLYDVGALQDNTPGPTLQAGRIGASIFDAGIRADGERAFVIAGGADNPTAPGTADRFALVDDQAEAITGTHAQAALLDGGAVLTAFALDADSPDGAASVIVPDVAATRTIARAPDLRGVRLVRLEDGRVLGVGGPQAPAYLLYDPTRDRWQTVTPAGPAPSVALEAPALVPLADGSVLVLGGRYGSGLPSRDAWVFRPSLVGQSSGSVTVVPNDSTATVLTPVDPQTVTRGADWQLTAIDDLARALVGGPRMAEGAVQATVRVRSGGVALIAQHRGAGAELVAELVPGSAARLVRRALGATRTACTGRVVPAFEADVAASLRLEVVGTRARVLLGDAELVACDVGSGERGSWGVAALGAGAQVGVGTVIVAR